jgi:hypothetical protein
LVGKPGLLETNSMAACLLLSQAVRAFVCPHNEIVTAGLAYPAASGNLLFRR